jgi:exonuclease III
MKLLTLNTWGGRAGKEELLRFFVDKKEMIDIFCLQEIWSAPYPHLEGADAGGKILNHDDILVEGKQEIAKALPDHSPLFHPHHLENYGLMTLVRNTIGVRESGEVFVHKWKGFVPDGDIGHHARNIQYVSFIQNEKPITVINFHGLWNGQGKTDSDDRIAQSQKIIDFLNTRPGEIILVGDFNLLPDTRSIKMFEEFGLRNLITAYDITSTRTAHYSKPDKFADYIFVSSGIRVREFTVLPDTVSDHAPLFLDIE